MRWAALLGVALVGCHGDKARESDAAPAHSGKHAAAASASAHVAPPRTPLAPPPTNAAVLVIAGKSAPLSSQIAYLGEDGMLTVVLADRPYACEDLGAKLVGDAKRRSVTISVPPGPNASYFAGGRVGVAGQIDAPDAPGGSYLDPNELTVEIASADTKTGGHVTGWASWARGDWSARGTFDAKVCAPVYASAAPALAADAPPGDVKGAIAGEAFVGKKALAVVRHSKKLDVDYVSEIDVLASADVGCANLPLGDKQDPSLAITDIGGASVKEDYSGTMQPMVAMYASSTWKVGKPRVTAHGWIRLDALDFGAPLAGTLRLSTAGGTVAGAFTAEVCKK